MKRFLITLLILFMAVPGFTANSWRDSDTSFFDGNTLFNDVDTEITDHVIEPSERFFLDPYRPMVPIYNSASAVTVTAGTTVCENSAGTLVEMRRNTASTSVGWGSLDTGVEANAQYYIFANCDADATTSTFKISLSSSLPSGVTLYKLIGSFANESGDITRSSIAVPQYAAQPTDSTGLPIITAIYSYSTSASSFTSKTSDLKFAYGTLTVAGSTNSAISNLPFTSASTYSCTVAGNEASLSVQYNYGMQKDSGSGATISNFHPDPRAINWACLGY